jgi:hypothetical protein
VIFLFFSAAGWEKEKERRGKVRNGKEEREKGRVWWWKFVAG